MKINETKVGDTIKIENMDDLTFIVREIGEAGVTCNRFIKSRDAYSKSPNWFGNERNVTVIS